MRKFFDQSEETFSVLQPLTAPPVEERAWVVFSGKSDWPWLKILRPGFRHCFVIVHDGTRWLSLDPLLQHTELKVHDVPPDFDLPGWLTARGNRVMPAPLNRAHKKPAPVMLYTCVEAVKRVLGLHTWGVMTPWQLYRHLTRYQGDQDAHNFQTHHLQAIGV